MGYFLEFGARWPILMHARERDNFTDSKYVPLRRRTFEQFNTQIFHRVSLSGGFVLQKVRNKSLRKLESVLVAKFNSSPVCGVTNA